MAIPLTGSAEGTAVSSLFCDAVCNDFIHLRCTCLAFLVLEPGLLAIWPTDNSFPGLYWIVRLGRYERAVQGGWQVLRPERHFAARRPREVRLRHAAHLAAMLSTPFPSPALPRAPVSPLFCHAVYNDFTHPRCTCRPCD